MSERNEGMTFDGSVAVVTGAGSGIGRATVEWLRASGAHVVAVDLDGDRFGWADGDPDIVTLAGDVTDLAVNERMAATARERFGRLDHLVLNAGMSGRGDITTVDLELVERLHAVNMGSAVLGLRTCVPLMREGGGGAVVLTASVSGLGGEPARWPYGTAKAAVISLCQYMAIDLGRDSIRVNAVCPGPIRTGMSVHIEDRDPDRHAYYRDSVPLKRWGEAAEVASAIGFLLSPAASFVNGVALPVDGGQNARNAQGQPPGTW